MSERSSDARGAQPDHPSSGEGAWPGYPPTSAYGTGSGYGVSSSYGNPPSYGTVPSYGTPQQYGNNPYETNPYETNPYEVSPYAGSYGSVASYGAPVQPHPQATIAMVLGLVGVTVFPLVGIVGLILGLQARREIDAQPGRYSGRGLATAGFVLGIISVFACFAWLALFVIIATASSS